jgi:hypothetical protein
MSCNVIVRQRRRVATLLAALALAAPDVATAADPTPMPIFDAHLHYNWEPVPHFTVERVLSLFREQNIMGILATSRPNDGTRALYEAKQKDVWVVPFIRPYRVRPDIQTWMSDPQTEALIATEFKRGYYQGHRRISPLRARRGGAASQEDRRLRRPPRPLSARPRRRRSAGDTVSPQPEGEGRLGPHRFFDRAGTGCRLSRTLPGALVRAFLSLRHHLRRQTDGGMEGLVRALPRPLPARLRHLGQ